MPRVAIPIFRSRISPIFDACTRLLLVDIEQDREIHRNEIYLDELSLNERRTILRKSQVRTIICGGISSALQHMLQRERIELISGVAGEVNEVLTAYLSHALDEPRFHMPGLNERGGRRGLRKERDAGER